MTIRADIQQAAEHLRALLRTPHARTGHDSELLAQLTVYIDDSDAKRERQQRLLGDISELRARGLF